MGRRLGQHFLHDNGVLHSIMAAAALAPGECVLETGPGRGALTGRLLEAGARVTAVELDPALCRGLLERWGEHPAFRLVEGDILAVELAPAALFASPEPYAVVANLPYYLSTPFFFRIIAQREHCSRMVLMVQKEIAERLVAMPEQGKEYGSLSVAAHHAFRMRYLFSVPPEAFRPRPKVQSAVVGFEPKAPVLEPEAEQRFLAYVKQAFTTRRKMMWSPLRRRYPRLPPEQGAAIQELVANKRAEALTPEEHLQVFRLLEAGADRELFHEHAGTRS
ncbi:MAG: 16S rRNA (adenine(1518)-N(6)/adenine(1519)-N(6))-dimethyltransferase RsmA [SAR324 cluster bacterium]|nr:16S rRNA (adenine(1518)-N(6)/adenine(1519)-N(6))-dimethyltransferase RsmA [SAR324 cluster bacterium]